MRVLGRAAHVDGVARLPWAIARVVHDARCDHDLTYISLNDHIVFLHCIPKKEPTTTADPMPVARVVARAWFELVLALLSHVDGQRRRHLEVSLHELANVAFHADALRRSRLRSHAIDQRA